MDDVSVLTYISYEFFFAVCASSTPVNRLEMHPYYHTILDIAFTGTKKVFKMHIRDKCM